MILKKSLNIILQVKYELQIVSQQAKKDKNEIESERARLRSLIGNVAHDIKIPLKSIGTSNQVKSGINDKCAGRIQNIILRQLITIPIE